MLTFFLALTGVTVVLMGTFLTDFTFEDSFFFSCEEMEL